MTTLIFFYLQLIKTRQTDLKSAMFGERLDLAVISDGKSPGSIPLGDIIPAYQQEGCTCCVAGGSSGDFSRVMQRTVSKLDDRGIIGDQEGETRQMIQDAGFDVPDDTGDFSDELTFVETVPYGVDQTVDVFQNSRTGGYQTRDNKGVVSGSPESFTYTAPDSAAYSVRRPARYNSMAVRKMLENRKKKQGLDLKIRKAAAAFGITPVLPWYAWVAVIATIAVVVFGSMGGKSEEVVPDELGVTEMTPDAPSVGLVPPEPLGGMTVTNLIGR